MVGTALNTAVIGCGIGGQAAALFLSRAGHQVTVFEGFATPKALGAGLLLQPTGQAILDKLGLLGEILGAGARVERLYGTNRAGRDVLDLSYADENTDWFGIGIHRGVLFSALHDEVSRSGIHLCTDSQVLSFTQDGSQAILELADRSQGGFDLVVVAEGGSLRLPPNIWVRSKSVPYPWGALWTLCPDPEGRFPHTLRQYYDRASVMIGVLPIGHNPSDPSGSPNVSFFWSLKAAELQRWRGNDLDSWKDDVRRYWPEADYLLCSITSDEQLLPATYRDNVMWPWNVGRVVYIGDAAHCTSPQLGQGANLALVDAYVLSETLTGRRATPETIPRALTDYSRRRRDHISYYQLASRLLTPFFQSEGRALAVLRDAFLGPFCRFPPTRSFMVRTLAGVHKGLLGTFRF